QRSPMRATVEVYVQFSASVANEYHRTAADSAAYEISRISDFRNMRQIKPASIEDCSAFGFEDVVAREYAAMHSETPTLTIILNCLKSQVAVHR
ncbi:hypothetical protein, partial [Hoeflea sp.]|uniref:hypothetical protein n=1 Tax=Hoeflea sp. TaxID=1940281 RepID=UPI0025C1695B